MANIGPSKQPQYSSSSSSSASASNASNRQPYRPYAAPAAAPGHPPSSFQRDAAYSEIFGGRPPPDRSHTMTSQTPMFNPGERSRTMTSRTPDPYMAANLRQNPNPANAYAHGHPPPGGSHAAHHRPPPMMHGHPQYMHPHQHPPPMVSQRSPMPGTSATLDSHPAHAANAAAAAANFSRHPQQQRPPLTSASHTSPHIPHVANPHMGPAPSPVPSSAAGSPRPYPPGASPGVGNMPASGRQQYPLPKRLDARVPSSGGNGPGPGAPGMGPPVSAAASARTGTMTGIPHPSTLPPPALNSDPYRSRSLARVQMPPYQPPPGSYHPAQVPAMPGGIRPPPGAAGMYVPQGYRTAQGRVLPERAPDERSMSMSTYARDQHFAQTINTGRVIPSRAPIDQHHAHPQHSSQHQSPVNHAGAAMPLTVHAPTGSVSSTVGHGGHAVPGYVSHAETSPALTMASSASAAAYDKAYQGRRQSEGSLHSLGKSSSMTSTILPPDHRTMTMTMPKAPPMANGAMVPAPMPHHHRRAPLVYPALLSRVGRVFKEKIQVGDRVKNDLAYTNAFTGAEAVDLLSYIIKTSDRNLALLLGRALDAQKFFHDVTYDHRLRDTPAELYQFKEEVNGEAPQVNGVFTLLTECYSPTCTKDKLCYSIACPRRLEQQARLNMKLQPGLKSSASKGSLRDNDDDSQKLWINMVPKEVAEQVSDKEKKRQEIIFEIMYTERDFVKDLEYIRDFWMRPLRSMPGGPGPIPEHRRERFIRTVFGNILEVLATNSRLSEALNARQKESHVVKQIGDIFMQWVPKFEPFIKYGSNQLYGKHEFEKEKANNPYFAKFVDDTERLKESRKLELNGYLTKPTTRLARYPLLLENVMKNTADDNPDKEMVGQAITLIKALLFKVNSASGKAENHFNLLQLNEQLKFNPLEYVDLKLTEENRVMLLKTGLKKGPAETSEVTVYLFDHAVLLVRIKTVNKKEEYRVYRKPIPLELLVITQMEEVTRNNSLVNLPRRPAAPQASKEGYPITFRHLGKGGYELTLYATTAAQRKKFIELVENQQRQLRERNSGFCTKMIVCEKFFSAINRVNCLVPTDGGRKLLYGTDNGVYISDRSPQKQATKPRKVIDASNVTQIDIIEEYQLLLVLTNKTLFSYSLDALDTTEQGNASSQRPKKVQGHANFFKVGVGLGRHLVCAAKTSTMSTTIKVYEPTEHFGKNKKKSLGSMFNSGQESFKLFKEFYINAESCSMCFLRSTLCVGCSRGFEVISLDTSERQSLLDLADTSLDFVARRENVKAMHIERFNVEFILNYSDFSFFVNGNGWRTRPDWKITWEGTPTAFALSYPYLLAFEPSFIEIRHIESSELVHIMTGKNIRMLHSSTREILYAYEDESGEDVIASLDFWV